MRGITLTACLLMPGSAFGNSMAPVLPVISIIGWAAMPIIVALEALVLHETLCQQSHPACAVFKPYLWPSCNGVWRCLARH